MSWFRRSKITQQVTIILSEQYLTCGWIQYTAHNRLILNAYKKVPLTGHLDTHTFFNPTFIGSTITSFIKEHTIKNSAVSCAFINPLVTEQLMIKTHATPHPSTLIMAHTQHTLWDYQYLYPTDINTYVFYVCAVTQLLLLQYKLMAITHKLSLSITTSQTAALLQLYRYVHADAFRTSQLGIDMQRCNNTLEHLFSIDTLKRILTIPSYIPINPAQEKPFLTTMCGLFVSERAA